MTTVPWQEYDCYLQGADADLHGDNMVLSGGVFYCHWCGGRHIDGYDAEVTTYNADGDVIPTPKTKKELDQLINSFPITLLLGD